MINFIIIIMIFIGAITISIIKSKRKNKPKTKIEDLINAINENPSYFDAKDDAIWMNIEEVDIFIKKISRKYKEEMKFFKESFPINYDFPGQTEILNQFDELLLKMKSGLSKVFPPSFYEPFHKIYINMLEDLEEYSKNHRAYLFVFNEGASNDTPENRNKLIVHEEKSLNNLKKYFERRKNLKDQLLLELEASLKSLARKEVKYLKVKNL